MPARHYSVYERAYKQRKFFISPRHNVSFSKNFDILAQIPFCLRCNIKIGDFTLGDQVIGRRKAHTCYTCGLMICDRCAVEDPTHTPLLYSRHYCRMHDVNHVGCSCRSAGLIPKLSVHWGLARLTPSPPFTECSLCQNMRRVGEVDEVYLTRCGHAFHEACLGRWQGEYNSIHNSMTAAQHVCPLCRRHLV